jgi:hypothetical protein
MNTAMHPISRTIFSGKRFEIILQQEHSCKKIPGDFLSSGCTACDAMVKNTFGNFRNDRCASKTMNLLCDFRLRWFVSCRVITTTAGIHFRDQKKFLKPPKRPSSNFVQMLNEPGLQIPAEKFQNQIFLRKNVKHHR